MIGHLLILLTSEFKGLHFIALGVVSKSLIYKGCFCDFFLSMKSTTQFTRKYSGNVSC